MSLQHAVPKVHPATREVLPEDPMEMHGFEVPGDPNLMLRFLVEEYARLGWGTEEMMQLARDPNYQAFHRLLSAFGESELTERIQQILARCGVIRVSTIEKKSAPAEPDVVQIDLSIVRKH